MSHGRNRPWKSEYEISGKAAWRGLAKTPHNDPAQVPFYGRENITVSHANRQGGTTPPTRNDFTIARAVSPGRCEFPDLHGGYRAKYRPLFHSGASPDQISHNPNATITRAASSTSGRSMFGGNRSGSNSQASVMSPSVSVRMIRISGRTHGGAVSAPGM